MSRRKQRHPYRRYPARIATAPAGRPRTASRPRPPAAPVDPWPVRAAFLSIAALLERIAAEIRTLIRGQ